MSKRVKVLVSVVAILLLTVGIAVPVMADDGSTATDDETGRKGLLARVADKLGITEEELVNAFKQARQEMREDAFLRALDKAVEKGLIDEREAEEIKKWWEERPEVLDSGLFRRAFGVSSLGGGHMRGGHRGGWWSRIPKPAD